ncbi:hypothetical protein NLI96_g4484 [Meripilus lineatus]|uniref:Uncharacterized protein n=1 Tax=Meripilus lineatus TaxID=2056292 RepID=A0AAD5V6R3_9APHY|nr:hypothetical protein NLI96_g4484 [Physisporinus lineatus]
MLRHNRLHLHSVDSGHPQKGLISSHRAPPFTTFIMDPRASSVSDPNDYDVQMSDSESRPEPRRSPSARSTMSPMGSPRRSSPPSSRPPVSFVLPESPAIHHPGKPPRMYLPTRS